MEKKKIGKKWKKNGKKWEKEEGKQKVSRTAYGYLYIVLKWTIRNLEGWFLLHLHIFAQDFIVFPAQPYQMIK